MAKETLLIRVFKEDHADMKKEADERFMTMQGLFHTIYREHQEAKKNKKA